MLYVSLFFALFILGAAHAAARPAPHPTRWSRFLVPGACAVLAPCFLGAIASANACLFVLLAVALITWPFVRGKVPTFLPLSLAAALIAYTVVGWGTMEKQEKVERLRAKYPLESMAERVPEPRPGLRIPLSATAIVQLEHVEQAAEHGRYSPRVYHLRKLHEDTVDTFVNRPDFGAYRMGPTTEESLKDRSDQYDVPAQPSSPSLWPSGAPHVMVNEVDRDSLGRLHSDGLLDFVNPRGWGYAKERKAAGFLSHRFSRVPTSEVWQVQRIELVGLLKHAEPVVYPSDRLPAMADLHNAPTRPLDSFETAGVAAVRRGEDSFAARRGDEVRFVGAIRSAKQCIECHGGERGDLLGAFSYVLLPAEPVTIYRNR